MAERLPTPVHTPTGLPSCFAPCATLPPPALPGAINFDRLGDWNHQFPKFEVRTSDSPALDDLGRRALEGSRAQWVDYRQHHDVYNWEFDNPVLPQMRHDLARTIVFAESGFIPPEALDLSGTSPRQVELSDWQRQELWATGQVRVYDPNQTRAYLMTYVLQQGVDHIREREIEEFLTTLDWPRRIYLGHCLAAKLVERSVEPFEAMYAEFKRAGDLPPEAPSHPRDLVKERLTLNGRKFGPIFSALHCKLGPHNPRRHKRELEYQRFLAQADAAA